VSSPVSSARCDIAGWRKPTECFYIAFDRTIDAATIGRGGDIRCAILNTSVLCEDNLQELPFLISCPKATSD
jgi:hypothetical protein